jgi:hypothetical protein
MLCFFRRSFRTTLTLLNCWRLLQARLLLSHAAQEDGIGDVAVEQERRKFTGVERVGPQPIERKQLEKERECRKRGKFSGFRRLKFVYLHINQKKHLGTFQPKKESQNHWP